MSTPPPFPSPPLYWPLAGGRYVVAAGLRKLGTPMGGGSMDECVFQVDDHFAAYSAEKRRARAERLDKYFRTADYTDEVAAAVTSFILKRLVAEHPDFFSLEPADGYLCLRCALTGDVLRFDDSLRLIGSPYASALDALASQVQEDVAVVSASSTRHWLSAAHVCFPNGWAIEEKIGRSFAGVHESVAGMDEMNAREDEFVSIMIGATGGLVRFAWGVTPDARLDRHPADAGARRPFDPASPAAFVRVERQTIWGLSGVAAALFTIRTYLVDVAEVRRRPCDRAELLAAVRGMPEESAAYKGLSTWRGGLIRWLAGDVPP